MNDTGDTGNACAVIATNDSESGPVAKNLGEGFGKGDHKQLWKIAYDEVSIIDWTKAEGRKPCHRKCVILPIRLAAGSSYMETYGSTRSLTFSLVARAFVNIG